MTWTCAFCCVRHDGPPEVEHQHLECCGVYSRGCEAGEKLSGVDIELALAVDHKRQCRKHPAVRR